MPTLKEGYLEVGEVQLSEAETVGTKLLSQVSAAELICGELE